MLKKNCHQVLGSQKSKLTSLELIFQTAGAINPPPPTRMIGLEYLKLEHKSDFFWESFLKYPYFPITIYT